MANFYDFEVWVDWQDFDKAKAGDKESINRIKKKLSKVFIYFHAFRGEDGEIPVSLADVISAGIVTAVQLYTAENQES